MKTQAGIHFHMCTSIDVSRQITKIRKDLISLKMLNPKKG